MSSMNSYHQFAVPRSQNRTWRPPIGAKLSGRNLVPQSLSPLVPGFSIGSFSRSVTSASAASRRANSSVQHLSGARQLQLPAATAGLFMRESEPSSSRSCAGTTAITATLARVARISGHAGRSPPAQRELRRLPFRFAHCRPPALGRVVVVRAGIGHGFHRKAMRQVRVRSLVAEAELQHLHSRHSQLEAQRVNFRCDQAQVLSHKRKLARVPLQWREKVRAPAPSPIRR